MNRPKTIVEAYGQERADKLIAALLRVNRAKNEGTKPDPLDVEMLKGVLSERH